MTLGYSFGDLFDAVKAREAKDRALALHEAHQPDWLERARNAAERMWAERQTGVTVDMIRERVGPPPEGFDRRVFGAVFRRKDGWEAQEWICSERVESHGRPIRVFRKAEKARAA